jgi:uncharacterized protein (DUF58 family)
VGARIAAALSTLTTRGRCLVVAGGALLLVGVLLGERALVRIAVFVLALPLIAAVVVARQRFAVSSRRTVTPTRVPRGQDAEVALELTNTDRRTGGVWELTEQLPDELGAEPRFLVERLTGGEAATLRYRVHGGRRGRHVLGPLRLRLVDPFGLVARTCAGTDTVPLVVVPRVRPLGPGGPIGGSGGTGEGARRAIAVHGEDDVSTREYRHGDDLRKVHWRATARAGELMVRLEERPWRAQATLLLDTRSRAHLVTPRRGSGLPVPVVAGDDAPPPDSLEWLIEAAATIGTTLTRRGTVLRVVTEAGDLPSAAGGGLGPEELLDRLAGLEPSRIPDLATGADRACRLAGDGPLLCLLGAVGPDDVVDLVRARTGPVTDVAILTDAGSWAEAGATRGRRTVSAVSRAELTGQREQVAELLRAAGWHVAVAGAGSTVDEVWHALSRSPAPSGPSLRMPA